MSKLAKSPPTSPWPSRPDGVERPPTLKRQFHGRSNRALGRPEMSVDELDWFECLGSRDGGPEVTCGD